MEFYVGTLANLSNNEKEELARYRHQVFVKKLGWELICEDQMEFDQFDRSDTIYVIVRSDAGHIIGTSRLLPTTKPYLLGEVFPQLMGDQSIPCHEKIWELSRFAAVNFGKQNSSPLGHFSGPITQALWKHTLAVAAEAGVERLITVSVLGIERLIRYGGFTARRACSPVVVNGQTILVYWIEVPKEMKASETLKFNYSIQTKTMDIPILEEI